MSSACRLAFASWAALILTLCAGCDRAPRGQRGPSADSSGSPVAEQKRLVFDRLPRGKENRVPVLSGTPGTLRYRPGCLFIDAGSGDETGLVVPAYVTFDGKRMKGNLKRPDGEPISVAIGEFVNLTGRVIANPRNGRYSCDTKMLLIADHF